MKTLNYRALLIIVVLAACAVALWPTFESYQLGEERKAAALKGKEALAQWDSTRKYRDDPGNVFAQPIKLGLDLQGGMYVTMEVDIPGLLYEGAQREAVDETFEQVIDATRKEAALSDEAVLDIFTRNFNRIAAPQGKTLMSYYDLGDLGANANDEGVIQKLARNIEDAVDQAVEVIRRRIDKFGVSETNIQKVAGRRIVLELPGVTDPEGVRSLIQTTARLEFKQVYNNAEAVKLFQRIDQVLAGKVSFDTASTAPKDTATTTSADTTKKVDSTKTAKKGDSTKKGDTNIASTGTDSAAKPTAGNDTAANPNDTTDPYAGLTDEQKVDSIRKDHPFTTLFQTLAKTSEDGQPQDAFGAYFMKNVPDGIFEFYTTRDGMTKMKDLLSRPDVKAVIPEDMVVAFSAYPEYGSENPETAGYGIYVLPVESELTGEVISDAIADMDQQSGRPAVTMMMNADGADQWAEITGRNIKKRIAIVLDSSVYSAPVVQGKIPGGTSSITGSKDFNEATLLAVVLKAGALKAPVRIIEERIVGPSLGEDSIEKGVWSTIIATLLVFVFMAVYYRTAGLVANLGLVLNIFITLAILAVFRGTLTLPGIGGLVLTIGMAVDGNILIYERIREEMAAGKSLRNAVQLGYQKAWTAVLDTHITTLISGVILLIFGSGPIQGFAVTLIIGLTATLFTAVYVTRTIFIMMIDRGAQSINFGQPKPVASASASARKPELAS